MRDRLSSDTVPPNAAKAPTIILCGGGTGGHITPLTAIAQLIKNKKPEFKIIYIGEEGGRFNHIVKNSSDINERYYVRAGKFRRYHGESWFRRITDIKTIILNLRDIFFVLTGIVQSYRLLKRLKPDLVFIKGGFVGVPVGLAASLLKIPYITHDSDVLPGLANRLIAKKASKHAVGMPTRYYKYPKDKTVFVGIPLSNYYQPVTNSIKKAYREELNISSKSKVILVEGGSSGAARINHSFSKIAPILLSSAPNIIIIHQAGEGKADNLYDDLDDNIRKRIILLEYERDFYKYSGAADLVIARAGATRIAELSLQGKACIFVPNPELTGGHQVKNAKRLEQEEAATVISESKLSQPDQALKTILDLIKDKKKLKEYERRISFLAKPDATNKIVELIINYVENKGKIGA